jgi:hypothetical protein
MFNKRLKKELARAITYGKVTYSDYVRLYVLCMELLKAHKTSRDTNSLFVRLESELSGHLPCPY